MISTVSLTMVLGTPVTRNLRDELHELRGFDRGGCDVRVGERHLVRQDDRPGTMRSGRCAEDLNVRRLVDGREQRQRFVLEIELARAGNQDASTSPTNS